MTHPLKAISVWQPWASLLIHGIKTHETRSWQPPLDLLGHRIAIHAAVTFKAFAAYRHLARLLPQLDAATVDDAARILPFGAIIGTACLAHSLETTSTLADCIPQSEKDLGDWSRGRYAWRLTDPRPLHDPIPFRGQQRLWTVPAETAARIYRETAA